MYNHINTMFVTVYHSVVMLVVSVDETSSVQLDQSLYTHVRRVSWRVSKLSKGLYGNASLLTLSGSVRRSVHAPR